MSIEDEEDARIMAEIESETSAKVEEDDEEEELESTAKVDSELDEAATDDDRKEIREKRRLERKSKAQRHRDEVDSLRRKIEALESQNNQHAQQIASINDTNTGSQLAVVDSKIIEAQNAAAYHKQRIAVAVSAGDGAAAAQATQYMIEADNEAKRLANFKNNAVRAMQAPKTFAPEAQKKIADFQNKHKWFNNADPNDTDSQILLNLDVKMIKQGFKPETDEYWAELEAQGRKYLPHRFRDKVAPRSPVSGGSASTESSGEGWKLSKERIQLMKDANIWNNQKERNEMIKYYREADKKAKR